MYVKRIKIYPDRPCRMGLTDPCSWADKGQAQLVQRSIMDRHSKKPKWKRLATDTQAPSNPKVNGILAQRGFRKIQALMKIFFVRKCLVHHVWTIQEDSYKEKTSTPRKECQPSTTIKAPIPSKIKVHIIHSSLAL